METFVTESISPYNFYERRCFGNDLTRFLNKKESYTDLLLFTEEPEADFAIEIDESLLNKDLMSARYTKKKCTYFSYPCTIYYQREKVRFRFANEDVIKSFIAESKIIIEVKTIEKYSSTFFVQDQQKKSTVSVDRASSLQFDIATYIQKDELYNSIKGAIVSYMCGACTSISQESQTLLLALNELKNQVAGFNTDIMISEGVTPNIIPIKMSLAKLQAIIKTNTQFEGVSIDVLKHIINEIFPLANKRCSEISNRKSPSFQYKIEKLKEKEYECTKMLDSLEDQDIYNAKSELKLIKDLEVEAGKRKNKSREYFPKGTKEYIRKQELKSIIKAFEEDNKEYKELKGQIKEIRSELSLISMGGTQFDAALEALFIRFSDNINSIVKRLKDKFALEEHNVSLETIVFDGGLQLFPNNEDAEKQYFNIVLNYIIQNPNGKQSVISDNTILDIISNTGAQFKNTGCSTDEKKSIILDTIRNYWLYKKQKSDSFSIPHNMPVLQAIMAFFVKPRGFDQIERFMMNKAYSNKELAYMLCGCLMGYAALPKTLTTTLYTSENQSQEKYSELYLEKILKKL